MFYDPGGIRLWRMRSGDALVKNNQGLAPRTLAECHPSDYAEVVDGVPTDKDVHRTRHPEHGRTPGGYRLGIRQLVGGNALLDSQAATCAHGARMFRSEQRERCACERVLPSWVAGVARVRFIRLESELAQSVLPLVELA